MRSAATILTLSLGLAAAMAACGCASEPRAEKRHVPGAAAGTDSTAIALAADEVRTDQPALEGTPRSGARSSAESAKATAIFAGGCFWCEETAFEGLEGVLSVTSGYTGGDSANPSYEEVSSGRTGHAEAVLVEYDPSKVSYDHLLTVFWHSVDPLQKNGQFCDHGPQYRSAIFYAGEAQRKSAEESKARLEEQPRFRGTIATQIVPASVFTPAEEYHQDFYKKSPGHYQAYRRGCGRDARLAELWGEAAGGHR